MALETKLPQTTEESTTNGAIKDSLNILAYLHCHPLPQVLRVHSDLPGYHLQIEDYRIPARAWAETK